MNVNIYARVSTDDKDQDPERQVIKCKQYCELHNHNVLNVYTEYTSGDSNPFTRVQCSKALENAEAIIIYSMDRLTRQHPIKVIRFINDLKDRSLKVISVTEPVFNMEHELSEVMLYLISWFNNYFLTKLKRDIQSGLDRARKEGKTLGRPKVKFNKYKAYQLLIVEGKSFSYVSNELGVNRTTLYRFKKDCLKNPITFINKRGISKTLD